MPYESGCREFKEIKSHVPKNVLSLKLLENRGIETKRVQNARIQMGYKNAYTMKNISIQEGEIEVLTCQMRCSLIIQNDRVRV